MSSVVLLSFVELEKFKLDLLGPSVLNRYLRSSVNWGTKLSEYFDIYLVLMNYIVVWFLQFIVFQPLVKIIKSK